MTNPLSATTDTERSKVSADVATEKTKKLPIGSIPLVLAGDLLFARLPNRDLSHLFKRYELLFENFANMEATERLLNYRFLLGLMLTSHAKKTQDSTKRKELFDLKNQLFFSIVNDRDARRKVGFKYLVSKNFRITKFCPKCEAANAGTQLARHKWNFCKNCEVDRKFYNVLSIHHRFKDGSATLFLSNDLIKDVENHRACPKGNLDDFKEEALLLKFHYNVKNLDVFELSSVIAAQKKFRAPSIAT